MPSGDLNGYRLEDGDLHRSDRNRQLAEKIATGLPTDWRVRLQETVAGLSPSLAASFDPTREKRMRAATQAIMGRPEEGAIVLGPGLERTIQGVRQRREQVIAEDPFESGQPESDRFWRIFETPEPPDSAQPDVRPAPERRSPGFERREFDSEPFRRALAKVGAAESARVEREALMAQGIVAMRQALEAGAEREKALVRLGQEAAAREAEAERVAAAAMKRESFYRWMMAAVAVFAAITPILFR